MTPTPHTPNPSDDLVHPSHTGRSTWTLADIAYERIRPEPMRDNAVMFNLIAAASFVEITTPLYT
ncbi:MAG TPA: hypothetical protein VL359_02065, partial [bacterium]|nr:hypothetical protein [bacterium]